MSLRDFRKAGHPPTLLASFLYFDISFMVWVILGPLGPFIGEAYKLSATQKGFLTAIPLLGGVVLQAYLGLEHGTLRRPAHGIGRLDRQPYTSNNWG